MLVGVFALRLATRFQIGDAVLSFCGTVTSLCSRIFHSALNISQSNILFLTATENRT